MQSLSTSTEVGDVPFRKYTIKRVYWACSTTAFFCTLFKYHFVLARKMWYKAITFLLITLIRIVCLIRIIGQPGCEVGFPILNNSPATSQIFWSVWWCCCSILAELFGHLSFSLTDLVHQLLNLSSPADWSYRLLIFETLLLPDCPQVSYSLFVMSEDRITRWRWSNHVKSCPHWIWLESV